MTNDVTTPIWLLDVDGVINALPWYVSEGGRDIPEPAWSDYTEVRASPGNDGSHYPQGGYRITYSPTLVQRIVALHESGVVEVRWLTTWGSGANGELRRKLGIPQLEVSGEMDEATAFQGKYDKYSWWKLPCAQKVRAENPGRPIIWTDDDLYQRSTADATEWLHGETGILAIAPDEAHGITPEELAMIESFISEMAERVA